MLTVEQYEKIDRALHAIEAILCTLPRVIEVDKSFELTRMKIPDPIRYVCKGNRGEYALIFTWENIQKWQGNFDVLGAFLEEEIIWRNIYPSTPKSSYVCTSSGLLKV